MNAKRIIFIGSISAAIAVILGAFGAHYLKPKISSAMLVVYQTGVQYHFYHSLGLIVIGLIITNTKTKTSFLFRLAGWIMLSGIVLFSGSLYLLSTTHIRWLVVVTPIGGTAFIVSWILTGIGIIKKPKYIN
jgi:uncharacterized membrane protein YgdD (TMEM256/DUF423 family)